MKAPLVQFYDGFKTEPTVGLTLQKRARPTTEVASAQLRDQLVDLGQRGLLPPVPWASGGGSAAQTVEEAIEAQAPPRDHSPSGAQGSEV